MNSFKKLALGISFFSITACGVSGGPSLPAESTTTGDRFISTIANSVPATGFWQGGLVIDSQGNLYGSSNNFGVYKMTPPTYALTAFSTGAATAIRGLTIDSNDNLYATESSDGKIYMIDTAGTVTFFAGTGASVAETDGPVATADFMGPQGIAVDLAGDVYVADTGNTGNNHLRLISGGIVSTIATLPDNVYSLAVDIAGNVYGVSQTENKLYKFSPPSYDTVVLAGSGTAATTDGIGAAASFNGPAAVTVDRNGTLYVSEALGNVIRKITATGIVTTYAGSGIAATTDGTAAAGAFNMPGAMAISPTTGTLFVQEVGPAGVGGGNILRKVK